MKKTELLADNAYDWIQNKIFDGTYSQGQKIVTQDIADTLGMSRTPVVAAINRLVAQGIATEIPHRGVIVAKMEPKQIRDFIDTRKMMETYAVAPAIRNASYFPGVLKEMETYAEELSKLTDTDFQVISRMEKKFHTDYMKLANNNQLLKLYESNWGVGFAVFTYVISNVPIHDYKKSCDQHLLIVDCLKNGREAELREAMETHLDDVYKSLNMMS